MATSDCSERTISNLLGDNCHYFTLIAAEKLKSQKVAIFYLKASGRVIHSAVVIDDDTVMDALGERPVLEVEASIDAINNITSNHFPATIYDKEGACISRILLFSEFDPAQFYNSPPSNLNMMKKDALLWLKRLRQF